MVRVLVEAFPGLRDFAVDLRQGDGVDECLDEIFVRIPPVVADNVYVTLKSGKPFSDCGELLAHDTVSVCLVGRLCGGKGGLGSQLRAQGGRMARRRRRQPTESENDQYRTLGGQRVGTVRRARDLAKALQAKPELEKQAREKKKSKLKAIVEAGERSQFNKKFDDAAFLEQSEELVKSVRESASVQAAAESSSASSSSPASSASSSKKPKGMDFFDEDYSSDDDDDE